MSPTIKKNIQLLNWREITKTAQLTIFFVKIVLKKETL